MEIIELLAMIQNLQVKENSKYYRKGLFKSQRRHLYLPLYREDNNIFFTAQILFILQGLKHLLPEKEKTTIERITALAVKNYPHYCNTKHPRVYNFWEKKPHQHFPNGQILNRYRKFALPDDVDSTSMVYLTAVHSDEEVIQLKHQLIKHANNVKFQVQNSMKRYKKLNAYSTWFGEKMPIELDVCVLSNLMYFILERKLPLNENDNDTINFIAAVIRNKEYFSSPFRIAPEYPNSAVIIYHLARLISAFNIEKLEPLKDNLVSDALLALSTSTVEMEKVILSTSLWRLGERANNNSVTLPQSKFSWFTAGLLSVYGNPFLMKLAENTWFHYKFSCEAFNLSLILENKVIVNTDC